MALRRSKHRNHRRNFWKTENKGLEVWEVPLDVQIKSRRGGSLGLVQCKPQIPNPWALKMRSRGLAWPHFSKGRVPEAPSNGCSFQMWGLIFLAEECFGFFSAGGRRGPSIPSWEIPWWSGGCKEAASSGLGSLRSCWSLGTENNLGEVIDEASAESQGDQCPRRALSCCTLQEFLSRTQGRTWWLFPLSDVTAASISLHFPSFMDAPFPAEEIPGVLCLISFLSSLKSYSFSHFYLFSIKWDWTKHSDF